MNELSATRIRQSVLEVRARAEPPDGALRAAPLLQSVAWVYLTRAGRPGLLLMEPGASPPRVAMRLGHILFQRGVECAIVADGRREIVRAAAVECTSDDPTMHEFFIRILPATLQDLTETSSPTEIESALRRLRDLLTKAHIDRPRDLQGLWAELLTIEQSSDPEQLIHAWRSDPNNDFDFLAEACAIEVKSTRGNIRRHRFSAAQLTVPPETLVLSYVLEPTDTGTSLFELLDTCSTLVAETPAAVKLAEMVLGGIGERFAQAEATRFDRELAVERLQAYLAVNIPAVRPPFPVAVSNVTFDVELTGALPYDRMLDEIVPGLWRNALRLTG